MDSMSTRYSLILAALVALPLSAAPKELPKAELNLKDMHGQKVRLRDYRGKVVMLDFWGNW